MKRKFSLPRRNTNFSIYISDNEELLNSLHNSSARISFPDLIKQLLHSLMISLTVIYLILHSNIVRRFLWPLINLN
jgi:hypothetical protein